VTTPPLRERARASSSRLLLVVVALAAVCGVGAAATGSASFPSSLRALAIERNAHVSAPHDAVLPTSNEGRTPKVSATGVVALLFGALAAARCLVVWSRRTARASRTTSSGAFTVCSRGPPVLQLA